MPVIRFPVTTPVSKTFAYLALVLDNSLKKLNLERLTVRLGLTVIYFPIFRQARPDFFSVFADQILPGSGTFDLSVGPFSLSKV